MADIVHSHLNKHCRARPCKYLNLATQILVPPCHTCSVYAIKEFAHQEYNLCRHSMPLRNRVNFRSKYPEHAKSKQAIQKLQGFGIPPGVKNMYSDI